MRKKTNHNWSAFLRNSYSKLPSTVKLLDLHPTQPQTITNHKHAAKRHCACGQHWVEITERRCRDQYHVVEKGPEQVLLDRAERFARECDGACHAAQVTAD